jgi:ATP adenylyltransferase
LAKKKKMPSKTKLKKQASNWPQKRNLLFRPERMKYVRKLVKETGCVFCLSALAKPSLKTLCVFKSKHSQIVLNKYPYNNGHLLILPREHIGDFLTLSPERYEDLHHTLRMAVEAVKAVYQPTGFNLGLNQGVSGGAGIPDHLHYHVIPRWTGDLNFFPLIANTKVVIETLDSSYKKFKTYFDQRVS